MIVLLLNLTTTSCAFLSGTSMSTPHVGGAWAVLKQQRPQASVTDIATALTETGVPVETSCAPSLIDYKPRIQIDAALAPSLIPAPTATKSFSYLSTASPTLNFAQAKPVGVGTVAGGVGDLLNLQVGLAQFGGPVDIYFAIYAQPVDPAHLYVFTPTNGLEPLAAGLIPWRKGVVGPITASLFGELSTSALPRGDYTLYFVVTPAGRLDSYYYWETDFSL